MRSIDQPIAFDENSPIAKVLKEPQLMHHKHDANLSADMRKFRLVSKQNKAEARVKRHKLINEAN